MALAERISVEVVHSPAPRTVQRMRVSLDAGATVQDALRATGWFASDPAGLSLGIWGRKTEVLQPFDRDMGWLPGIGLLIAIVIAHDAYFYWAHRTMHHPRLFKTFHRFHHRTITPTPWAAYSFAVPEAPYKIATIAAGTIAIARVISRRSHGRSRMLRNPSLTI